MKTDEAKFHNLFLQAPVLVTVLKGSSFIVELINEKALEIWGKSYEQVINKPLFEIFPELEDTLKTMLNNIYSTGESVITNERQVQVKRPEKPDICYFNSVYQPLRDMDNKICGIIVIGTEVTETVNARKQITESEQRLRNILEQAPDPILILRGQNMILDTANQALCELWRIDKNSIGKPFLDILPEMKGQGFFEMLQDVYFNDKVIKGYETPAEFIRKNGEKEFIYFNFVYQPYREVDGSISGVLMMASNVTQQVLAQKQNEKSEQDLKRYKHMADNATEPFILMRQDGTFAYLNDLALKRWGYTTEEAQHIRVPDVDLIYNDEVFVAAFAAAQKEKLPQFETLHKKKDGTIYPVEINMGGLTLEGKPHMFAIARDITERKKLEKGVRESEKKIRNFILQAPVAMCLYRGPQYIIEIVNQELLSIWDKSLDLVINKPVFEVLPQAQKQGFEAMLDKVYTTGEKFAAFGIPITLPRNGKPETIYVNLVYQAYLEADGVISGIVEVVSNVTEQVLATQQIEESEKQFRTFADSIQNLAWIANGDGWIYWYNQQWYDYTGTTIEEMKGWGWDKVHHHDHTERVVAFVKEAWKKDEAFELTFPLRRHDGEYRWFLTRAYPVKNANGNIERWIGTNTDIHEQKISEQKKDEFISIASHEMKTPLTSAKGYLELLQMTLEEENDASALYATKANHAIKRLQDLITELLDSSKIQNGKLNYTISTFDFNQMVEETIENVQLTEKNHQIKKSGKSERQVTGDKDRLQQVLINLLTNAIKYSPNAQEVWVIIEEKENLLQLAVRDFGIGMSKQHLDKIFERYYRVQEHAVLFQGLGIGLYISYDIIKRHEGNMWAESETGIGSTFYFTIPIRD